MESIQAKHSVNAAILHRHGASPDYRNYAGESARDMAAVNGDADLTKLLVCGHRKRGLTMFERRCAGLPNVSVLELG